jgi:hypothetical protein
LYDFGHDCGFEGFFDFGHGFGFVVFAEFEGEV